MSDGCRQKPAMVHVPVTSPPQPLTEVQLPEPLLLSLPQPKLIAAATKTKPAFKLNLPKIVLPCLRRREAPDDMMTFGATGQGGGAVPRARNGEVARSTASGE